MLDKKLKTIQESLEKADIEVWKEQQISYENDDELPVPTKEDFLTIPYIDVAIPNGKTFYKKHGSTAVYIYIDKNKDVQMVVKRM